MKRAFYFRVASIDQIDGSIETRNISYLESDPAIEYADAMQAKAEESGAGDDISFAVQKVRIRDGQWEWLGTGCIGA